MSKHAMYLNFNVDPIAKMRPRTNFITGNVYTPTKTRTYERHIKELCIEQMENDLVFDCPLSLEIVFTLRRPKSVSEKKRKYPTTKPDIDNLLKSFLDGLNGVLFVDDGCITHINCSKQYGVEGKIELWVKVLK